MSDAAPLVWSACWNRSMSSLLLSTLSLLAQAVPLAPVANAATPTSLVYTLAVKREWTLQDSEFCQNRAAAKAFSACPRSPWARLKLIETFAFRSQQAIAGEGTMLDYGTSAGLQVPFPWTEGHGSTWRR